MTKAVLLLAGSAALAALLGPGARSAQACTCDPSPPPREARDTAAAVFEGTVREITSSDVQAGPIRLLAVEFEVRRFWKGNVGPTLELVTPWSEVSCGVEFDPDGSYLVYADNSDLGLRASLCSRTTSTDRAASDFAALGPGSIPGAGLPLAAAGGGCSAGGGRSAPVGGSAVPLVGLMGLGIHRSRLRRAGRTPARSSRA